MLRDDVFRDDDVFAVARPPRAPAARTDNVPRPLVLRAEDELRVDDFLAVTRPPFAPAFFFCAVVPARPPFAPAAFTDIVPRLLVFRAVVELFLRDVAAVFFRDEVPPLREELELREDDDEDEDEDASPDFERCLLTVRAAISFARFVERPCFCSESLTCSYCRSRFALHDWGICVQPPRWFPGRQTHAHVAKCLCVCVHTHTRAISNGFDVGASTPPVFSIVTITCSPRATCRGNVNVRP